MSLIGLVPHLVTYISDGYVRSGRLRTRFLVTYTQQQPVYLLECKMSLR